MKKTIFLAAALFVIGSAHAQLPASQPSEPSQVIFFDDFDNGEIPDPALWKLCTKGSPVWNRYFDDEAGYSNVRIDNGILILTADKVDGKYRNGGIRTIAGFPLNTKVEVRARLFNARGGFPAIWQMPINGLAWPRSGEIDIMEWIQGTPDVIYHTIHTLGTPQNPDKSTGSVSEMNDITEWHTYSATRTAECVKFYVDDRLVHTYPNQHLGGEEGLVQYPFTERDFDIILNYSLGGPDTWPGEVVDEDLPARMEVDWVKVTTIPAAE